MYAINRFDESVSYDYQEPTEAEIAEHGEGWLAVSEDGVRVLVRADTFWTFAVPATKVEEEDG